MFRTELLVKLLVKHIHRIRPKEVVKELNARRWCKAVLWINTHFDRMPVAELHRLTKPPTPLDPGNIQWLTRFLEWKATPKPQGARIIVWLSNQRRRYRRGALDAPRQKLLRSSEVNWYPKQTKWKNQFERYLAVRKSSGPRPQSVTQWVGRQRILRKQGKLSKQRIALLDRHNFVWDLLKARWLEKLELYKNYRKNHRDPHMPPNETQWRALAIWLQNQRRRLRQRKMAPWRKAALDKLGWVRDLRQAEWFEWFEKARQFRKAHGHLEPGEKDNGPLFHWLARQRKASLTQTQRTRLDSIGMRWAARKNRFQERLDAFRPLLKKKKNSSRKRALPSRIRKWLGYVRRKYQQHQLRPEQIRQLTDLGVPLDYRRWQWNAMFEKARQFAQKTGHLKPTQVPHPGLHNWLKKQRMRREQLTCRQIRALNKIGMDWEAPKSTFQERMEEYERFRKEHDTPHVRTTNPRWRPLGIWISDMRVMKRKGHLPPEQEKIMRSKGIVFDLKADYWNRLYAMARTHFEKHSHLRVNGEVQPQLASWIKRLRDNKDQLTEHQRRSLEKIGMIWKPYEQGFQERLDQLRAYKAKFGHATPQSNDPAFNHLGAWLARRRTDFRKGRLRVDQRKALEEIGILWSPGRHKHTAERPG